MSNPKPHGETVATEPETCPICLGHKFTAESGFHCTNCDGTGKTPARCDEGLHEYGEPYIIGEGAAGLQCERCGHVITADEAIPDPVQGGGDVMPVGWLPFLEYMPQPDTDCLVWVKTRYMPEPFARVDRWTMQREAPVSFSSVTVETGYGWDESEFDEVLYWMPLPSPPHEASTPAVKRWDRTGEPVFTAEQASKICSSCQRPYGEVNPNCSTCIERPAFVVRQNRTAATLKAYGEWAWSRTDEHEGNTVDRERRIAFEAGWSARESAPVGPLREPMTIERACEVLNTYSHRGITRWWINPGGPRVSPSIASGVKGISVTNFEAIAIAEKYEREGGTVGEGPDITGV